MLNRSTRSTISYSDTNSFSKLVLDYLSGDEKLKPFYNLFPSIDSFKTAIDLKSKEKTNRELLVKVLEQQYLDIDASELVKNNIKSLLDKNTYTVTTGHQLCLFTGPLYFLYKVVDIINLAKTLNQHYPDHDFVPIYWMVTEDHDFAEINHAHVFGKKIEWVKEVAGPIGRIETTSLESIIVELEEVLGDHENAKYLIGLFKDSYLKHDNLAKATQYLVNELFGEYGLVILDPDCKELKNEFTDIIKSDIIEQTNYKLVNETIDELKSAGYHDQVKPREINVFYLEDDLRARIVEESGKYQVLDNEISFTKEELENELEKNSEKFGPNVVTRPLYQEKILPNLAYIGGGAEVAYWFEYKKMFEHHNIAFPIIFLRNSVMVLDEATQKNMEKLQLIETQLFKDENTLIKEYVEANSNEEITLKEEMNAMNEIFVKVVKKTEYVDKSLVGMIMAENKKQVNAFNNIEGRLRKAEKAKFETEQNKINKIKEKLFPDGHLQERHDNFITYYMRYEKDFIGSLIEHLDPLEFKFTILK
ncbi:MAG: bacillithiol biosynthesis cysteine-adding enzyme BshC [Bacteroidia bacterium]|nr:bacillithiol biosynthesis cysteine-adding enzyme BshC [Bacteroidia bacterium]